jgi:DNA repair protein RecO (recombination protein O)
MTKSLQAWVLHKQWSGDTSARVSFYTSELGLIQCLYKGARAPKKQALLQAFTPLWLAFDERYGHYYVRSLECTAHSLTLTGDALFSALYVNELLYYVLRPLYPDADLFNAYLMTLKTLALAQDKRDIQAVLRRFEWTVLKACGYSFSWTHDAGEDALIQAEHSYRFCLGLGFVRDNKGILGEHLQAIAQDRLDNTDVLKSAKYIMRQAIDHLLGGRELKSRGLYIKIKV